MWKAGRGDSDPSPASLNHSVLPLLISPESGWRKSKSTDTKCASRSGHRLSSCCLRQRLKSASRTEPALLLSTMAQKAEWRRVNFCAARQIPPIWAALHLGDGEAGMRKLPLFFPHPFEPAEKSGSQFAEEEARKKERKKKGERFIFMSFWTGDT